MMNLNIPIQQIETLSKIYTLWGHKIENAVSLPIITPPIRETMSISTDSREQKLGIQNTNKEIKF